MLNKKFLAVVFLVWASLAGAAIYLRSHEQSHAKAMAIEQPLVAGGVAFVELSAVVQNTAPVVVKKPTLKKAVKREYKAKPKKPAKKKLASVKKPTGHAYGNGLVVSFWG